MFSLPNARNEYRCKNKRKDGPGLCDQMIYQSTTRKHRSGKYMVLNAENGRGGMREDPHVCPDRIGTRFHKAEKINILEYRWYMQHHPCTHCGNKFDNEKLPLCPLCYKLECRMCGNRQTYIILEGQDSTICRQCGGNTDVIKVRPYVV